MRDPRQIVLSALAGFLPAREIKISIEEDRGALETGLETRALRMQSEVAKTGLVSGVEEDSGDSKGATKSRPLLPVIGWLDQVAEAAIIDLIHSTPPVRHSAPLRTGAPPLTAPPPVSRSMGQKVTQWASTLELRLYGTNDAGVKVFEQAERLLAEKEPDRHARFVLFVTLLVIKLGFVGKHKGSPRQLRQVVEGISGRLGGPSDAWAAARSPDALTMRPAALAPPHLTDKSLHVVTTDPQTQSLRVGALSLVAALAFVALTTVLIHFTMSSGAVEGILRLVERGETSVSGAGLP